MKMNKIIADILHYLAYAAGVASALWLSFPVALRVLLILMLLDIVTGAIRAGMQKKLGVNQAWAGVSRKIVTLLIIALAYALGGVLDPSVAGPLILGVTGYYCYTEGLSVIVNAAEIGVPIPDVLKNSLEKLQPAKAPDSKVPPVEKL